MTDTTPRVPDRILHIAQTVAAGEAHADTHDIPSAAARAVTGVALTAIWPQIREHFAQLLLAENPDRDADFTAGVDWAADAIRNS